MDKIIDEMKGLYNIIYDCRTDIATFKKNKINIRSEAWADAQGTAKEKEDYVRSAVSHIDESINLCEAKIERAYNMIKLLEYKLEYGDE